ncbi:hypothetical protein [Xanthovirga aplysinae]|uniref:hypothetical protein n=1 Tax=Xanthovirga aplysinae TaxID=2529853 RepID=UPI0012BC60C5|nr:hypothetical protein [Xanthovirga aplysinae]MTI31930.1 hypothetical protein [Xanthovirga aplysinae]
MLNQVLKLARILSIDVVLGACLCSLFVGRYFHTQIPSVSVICLGISVWVIYTVDHLLDASKISHKAHSPRHYFHQKYFFPLLVAVVLVGLVNFRLIFFLPTPTLHWGIILTALVVLYFLMLKIFRKDFYVQKEFIISLIYTAGIFTPQLSVDHHDMRLEEIFLIIQFFFIALANLLEFSSFERFIDKMDGHKSFVQFAGSRVTNLLIKMFVSVSFFLNVGLILYGTHRYEQLVITAMLSTLGLLIAFPHFFERSERYRIWGDAIFLYPSIIFLIEWV